MRSRTDNAKWITYVRTGRVSFVTLALDTVIAGRCTIEVDETAKGASKHHREGVFRIAAQELAFVGALLPRKSA